MASIGTVFIDHTPATVATATSKKTTKRFFADSSMSPLIMARAPRCRRAAVLVLGRAHAARCGFQLAFGVDQERARRHDPLASRQTACDRDAIPVPFAHDHLARLEV